MKYITFSRFKGVAICGDVNIAALTEVDERGDIICLDDKPVCFTKSENAHKHFARNDDGNGMERGWLTSTIIGTLKIHDDKYQERWDRVWNDDLCQKYKHPLHHDHWIWNHRFYNAPLEDLKHIYNLIKKEG